MTQQERRKERVIQKHEELLNRYQQSALHSLMSSGWQLFCVRASLFENPVVIVVNSDGDAFATMEYDGELNFTPDLSLRKDELRVCAAKKTMLSCTSAYLERRHPACQGRQLSS